MFENNADIDFGDDFTFNFEILNAAVSSKRHLETQREASPKKQKIIPLPKTVVARKFPGPAGILPDRKNFDSSLLHNTEAKNHEEIPCSQMSVSVFHSSPWLDVANEYDSLIEKYNIKWIKTNASLNKLPNQKAPFLAAIIKSIEIFEGKNLIVKVVLKDVSGEIQGTIIHSLYEEYSSSLVQEAVIVLKHCGVLTTTTSNNHYLTITSKNLLAVYCKNENEMVVINVQEQSAEDLLRDLHVKKPAQEEQSKENLKPIDTKVCSTSGRENEEWSKALEGLDMNSFFEDF